MNPNQALLEALQSQRNSALDNAAAKYAQIAQLRAEVRRLGGEISELKERKKTNGKTAKKSGKPKLKS